MGKKGKKKKKSGSANEELSTEHPMKQLLSKEMKIMHLTEKIKQFQESTENAVTCHNKVTAEFEEFKKHHQDKEIFLNEKLDDQYNKIDELEHTIVQLRLEKKNFGSDIQTKFETENNELQDQLGAADTEIQKLKAELGTLISFKKRKADMESYIQNLEEELSIVKKETRQQLLQLDRQHIRQKERMASEMKDRIAETEKVTWTKWQSMYDQNTQKAMQRNKDMTVELQYQSRAAEKLMANNSDLHAKLKDAHGEIRTYKNMQDEFGKTIQGYKRQVKQLTDRLNRLEDDAYIDVADVNEDQDAASKKAKRILSAGHGRELAKSTNSKRHDRVSVIQLDTLNATDKNLKGKEHKNKAALAHAKKKLGVAEVEIERLKAQVTKHKSKMRQALEDAATAQHARKEYEANVDFLGSFLLTAMEDLRKRKQKLAKVPKAKQLLRNKLNGEIVIPDIPYIQLPLQSREELISEFISHVRSLKLHVAAKVGRSFHHHGTTKLLSKRRTEPQDNEGSQSPSPGVSKLPDIHGSQSNLEIDISATDGNSVATQCSLDTADLGVSSFWSATSLGSTRLSSRNTFESLPSRENLSSRAFITSAQISNHGKGRLAQETGPFH